MSFLSKAYNFLKGKTSANDENFYAKSKSSFPNEIYPILSEPIVHKGLPSISRKNRQVLGEIGNRPWCVGNDRERKSQKASLEGFSPRAQVKNYWTNKGEKKVNNEVQQQVTKKISYEEGEEDDEEGVFKIQVCDQIIQLHFQVSTRNYIFFNGKVDNRPAGHKNRLLSLVQFV